MAKELKFNEKKHQYTIDKKVLTSVTTFVKKFFKPFDVKQISKYCAKARRNKGEKVTAYDVRREWKATAKEGTRIHELIEMYIMCENKKISVTQTNTKALVGADFFDDLMLKYPDYTPVAEERVYDEELGIAGTIDLVLYGENGEVVLVDWKTNKKIRTSGTKTSIGTAVVKDCSLTHYTLQLSLYAYILERKGFKPEKLSIAHLTEDGCNEVVMDYRKDLIELMIEGNVA